MNEEELNQSVEPSQATLDSGAKFEANEEENDPLESAIKLLEERGYKPVPANVVDEINRVMAQNMAQTQGEEEEDDQQYDGEFATKKDIEKAIRKTANEVLSETDNRAMCRMYADNLRKQIDTVQGLTRAEKDMLLQGLDNIRDPQIIKNAIDTRNIYYQAVGMVSERKGKANKPITGSGQPPEESKFSEAQLMFAKALGVKPEELSK